MIEHDGNVVTVHKGRADIVELLEAAWLSTDAANSLTTEQQVSIEAALAELSDLDVNKTDGDVQAKVGSYHFPLRKTIFDAVLNASIIASTAAGAIIATTATGSPVFVVGFIANTVKSTHAVLADFAKMSPSEVTVYDALLAVKKQRIVAKTPPYGATAADLEAFFVAQHADPPLITEILNQLDKKKIVTVEIVEKTVRYSVKA